jgi:hypothetical protein
MPAQRKEGKRLWGGYLEPDDFDRLDADFLAWFAKNCQGLVTRGTKSGNSEEK